MPLNPKADARLCPWATGLKLMLAARPLLGCQDLPSPRSIHKRLFGPLISLLVLHVPIYYPYITLILPLYIPIYYPYITLILPLYCVLSRGLFPGAVDASYSVEVEPFARVGALRYSGGILCYACYHNLGGPANWGW